MLWLNSFFVQNTQVAAHPLSGVHSLLLPLLWDLCLLLQLQVPDPHQLEVDPITEAV